MMFSGEEMCVRERIIVCAKRLRSASSVEQVCVAVKRDKMLSYRRETALQGGFVMAKSGTL